MWFVPCDYTVNAILVQVAVSAALHEPKVMIANLSSAWTLKEYTQLKMYKDMTEYNDMQPWQNRIV